MLSHPVARDFKLDVLAPYFIIINALFSHAKKNVQLRILLPVRPSSAEQ